jgi:hypothetical protein
VLVLVLVLVIEKSSALLPRSPDQNSCGKIGPLLDADGQRIEDEREQEQSTIP